MMNQAQLNNIVPVALGIAGLGVCTYIMIGDKPSRQSAPEEQNLQRDPQPFKRQVDVFQSEIRMNRIESKTRCDTAITALIGDPKHLLESCRYSCITRSGPDCSKEIADFTIYLNQSAHGPNVFAVPHGTSDELHQDYTIYLPIWFYPEEIKNEFLTFSKECTTAINAFKLSCQYFCNSDDTRLCTKKAQLFGHLFAKHIEFPLEGPSPINSEGRLHGFSFSTSGSGETADTRLLR